LTSCTPARSAPPNDAAASDDDAAVSTIDGGVLVDAANVPTDASLSTEAHLATGVTLDGLALFQGTRVALFDHGAPATANAPIVAGRRAVVRAYVDPGARAGQSFMGELEVREGSRVVSVLHDSRTLGGVSSDASPSSVLSFDLPAEVVTETASYAVRIVDPAGEAPAAGAMERSTRSMHAATARGCTSCSCLSGGTAMEAVGSPTRPPRSSRSSAR
jgi:hypothetical protein